MESEVEQYKLQLKQIQQEISVCTDEEKKSSLVQLENDIEELINLTKESMVSKPKDEDPLDAEYELFRAELALEDEHKDASEEATEAELSGALDELQEDLRSLPGMKCQAPFTYAWSDKSMYHNALVYRVDKSDGVSDSNDISVWVMFTNPTHKEMKPCPYYLDGDCKFIRENCRFSHGEKVSLSSLKDFKEPDFSNVSKGSHVLVKLSDDLWHRAIIQSTSEDACIVKIEASSKEEETHLQNILPLESCTDDELSSDESSNEEDVAYNDIALDIERENTVRKIFGSGPSSKLGDWEKHTKGFGSRIMMKMGYIHGSGLGVNADGRVEPVAAKVYPVGKSLDHCMMLKQKAGGDNNLFNAERKMKKVQRKHQEALDRAYEREKQKTDVFTFLNEKLGPSSSSSGASHPKKELRAESQKVLNVSSLQIAEDFKKIQKEMQSLTKSLTRQTANTPAYAAIKEKIEDCETRLSQLNESDRKITMELQQRKDRKKLTVF